MCICIYHNNCLDGFGAAWAVRNAGAVISVEEGGAVTGGQLVATWDPHTHPIITEVAAIHLLGLKENVIVGRLIPTDPGLAYHEERQRQRVADIEAAFITEEEASAELSAELTEELDDVEVPTEIVETTDSAVTEVEAEQLKPDA